jgi:thiol:disulfide interchange protein
MVTWHKNSILEPPGTNTVNDVLGGLGFLVFGGGLDLYWLFHPDTWKTLAGGAVLIVMGLFFLRRAWRRARAGRA